MAKQVPPRLPAGLRPAGLPADDLVDDAQLSEVHVADLDLSSRDARLVDIEACRFENTSLAGGRFDKLTVIDSVFERCDLANLELAHSSLWRVELRDCRATGLVVGGMLLRNVTLRDCLADLSVFRFATFTNVRLVDCRLQGADFVSADLTGAVFRRCDLTRAELSQVNARGALFVDCTWDGVRGVSSLTGATVVHGSPLDAHAFMVATASSLGIRLGEPADYPDDPEAPART
jgi:uncharacterized protein YjbI with pentapeptide repeats